MLKHVYEALCISPSAGGFPSTIFLFAHKINLKKRNLNVSETFGSPSFELQLELFLMTSSCCLHYFCILTLDDDAASDSQD